MRGEMINIENGKERGGRECYKNEGGKIDS